MQQVKQKEYMPSADKNLNKLKNIWSGGFGK